MTKAVEIAQKQRHAHLLEKIKQQKTLTAAEIKELETFELSRKKADSMDAGGGRVIATQKEAADYCGVTTRTIRSWEKEHVLRGADGHFLIERLDERIAEREEDSNPLKTRLLTASAAEKEYKAQLTEIQLKIKMGELIPREAIDTQRIERIAEVRRVLLSMIRKLPARLSGKNTKDMQEVVREEIYHALNVFAGSVDAAEDIMEDMKDLWSRLNPHQKKKLRDHFGPRKKTVKRKTKKKKG